MLSRLALTIVLLTILSSLAFAATQPSLSDATLFQDDGWIHRHVTVTLLEDGDRVRITRVDGETLVLPVASVASIRDAAGRDVTHLVIPGVEPPAPGVETAADEPPPPAVGLTRRPAPKPFTVALGGGVGHGQTSGDFYTGFESGKLYYADLRIALGPRNYLKLCYRTQNVFDDQIAVADEYDGSVLAVLDTTVDIRQYLVSIGFLSGATEKDLLRAYLELGLGYGDHVARVEEGGISGSANEGRLLLAAQGGVLVPFGRSNFGLDLSVHVAAKLLSEDSGEGSGFIVGGQAGLVVLFGRRP